MPRGRSRRRRSRHSFKIPIVTVAILAGQGAVAMSRGGGNFLNAAKEFGIMYTGFDPAAGAFNWPRLLEGWGPWIAKGLVSKVARGFGRPRVPFGLPISIS